MMKDMKDKREEVERKKNIRVDAGVRSPGGMSKGSCELKIRPCVGLCPFESFIHSLVTSLAWLTLAPDESS